MEEALAKCMVERRLFELEARKHESLAREMRTRQERKRADATGGGRSSSFTQTENTEIDKEPSYPNRRPLGQDPYLGAVLKVAADRYFGALELCADALFSMHAIFQGQCWTTFDMLRVGGPGLGSSSKLHGCIAELGMRNVSLLSELRAAENCREELQQRVSALEGKKVSLELKIDELNTTVERLSRYESSEVLTFARACDTEGEDEASARAIARTELMNESALRLEIAQLHKELNCLSWEKDRWQQRYSDLEQDYKACESRMERQYNESLNAREVILQALIAEREVSAASQVNPSSPQSSGALVSSPPRRMQLGRVCEATHALTPPEVADDPKVPRRKLTHSNGSWKDFA
jgi:hypothetical protein